jgi:hypothetical protein
MSGWTRVPTTYGVYKIKKRSARELFDAYGNKRHSGEGWVVRTPDGSEFPYASRAAALASLKGRARNPSRHLTKAQKRANASKRSKQRRVAASLKKFLASVAPAKKYSGAALRKNPGGSITITPLKAVKRHR